MTGGRILKAVFWFLVWAGMQEGGGSGADGESFSNSLGMKFVPVEGAKALFCIWETREKDIMKGDARRVTRCGSWNLHRKTSLISQNRRDPSLPEERAGGVGFRVVCEIASGAMKGPPQVRAPSSPAGVASAAAPEKPEDVPADAEYFDGRWFRIYHEDFSWEEAQKRCRHLGGRLAIVPDKETWQFLSPKIGEDHLWLGARDEDKEGKWKWVDGSRMKFAAWGPGQPNTGRARQDYVYTRKDGWNDIGEKGHFNGKLHVHGFICEWRARD